MNKEFAGRIRPYGISLGMWPFLRALWESNGITQRELAEKVRMRGSTTVAALNKLEKLRLVRRKTNKKDARKINLFLTHNGRELYKIIIPEVEAVNRQALSSLNADEQVAFKDMIRRIRTTVR